MSAARSDLCEVSPIAQRNASTRFDLPQPFGPTTPVRPGSITKSVGSTNDLKPWRRRRVSFIGTDSLLAGRESPCRDNTIEGNVGVWASRFWRLSWPDNGEAGPQGQPTRRAFPKAFVWLIRQPLRRRRGARRTHTPRPIVRRRLFDALHVTMNGRGYRPRLKAADASIRSSAAI